MIRLVSRHDIRQKGIFMKESRKRIIIKNSFAGLISQTLSLIMQFLIRIVILRYIGIEILGLSSTIISVLKTLSLAEFGFHTTVVYYLYEPLKECNHERVNQILTVLKRVYESIGILFIVISILTIPILKYILNGIDISGVIIGYYLLMSFHNACSYFLGYKRVLLFANQKEYISNLVDSIFDIVCNGIAIITIVVFRSYMMVLAIQIIQDMGANIIIQRICDKEYSFLKLEKFDKEMFKILMADVKNVFLGKLAGYVYAATDNLVVSAVIGTIYVGYLSNYTIFTSALSKIVNAIFNAMTPIIGNMLIENKKPEDIEADFRIYSYVRYLFASSVIIPWVFLADKLVQLFFGEQYILSREIVLLLAADLYIHIIYTACVEYINGSGKFRLDKNIAIVGALINIITSIYGVYKLGLEGVLVGTLISQVFFWLGRSTLVYLEIFKLNFMALGKYIIKNAIWLFVMIAVIASIYYIKEMFFIENIILSIMITFGLCEGLNVIVQLVLLHFSEEQNKLVKMLKTK